jgi:hypothetical protein
MVEKVGEKGNDVVPPERKESSHRYSEEDVKGILERAMTLHGRTGFDRSDLEVMAQQLGISAEELRRAEEEWFGPVPGEQEREAALRAEFTAHHRRAHLGKLASVAVTMLFLGALIYLKTPLAGIAVAFLFITFFTAFGTLSESVQALFTNSGPEFEESFNQWLEQRETRRLPEQTPRSIPPPDNRQ